MALSASASAPPTDGEARPQAVRLRYVSDREPGYRRLGKGSRTHYLDVEGRRLTDALELQRIRSLAIPPAWTDVWITTHANGHLQAVGRDARGRKQYRYHPRWRRDRDRDKYRRMLVFARRLPRMRRAVERDLRRRDLPREKVLAVVVRLLDLTHMRLGNEAYARLNRSYGLTTLRGRHTDVRGSAIRFRFAGKSGKRHEVGVRDRHLASVVRRIQELPGQRLFEYVDAGGDAHAIDSEDVNAYMREIAHADVTAKDFRTWAASVLAFRALRAQAPPAGAAAARREVARVMEAVAGQLGNTAPVCRASYVDPTVVDAWTEGVIARMRLADEPLADLAAPITPEEEAAVLRLLTQRRIRSRR